MQDTFDALFDVQELKVSLLFRDYVVPRILRVNVFSYQRGVILLISMEVKKIHDGLLATGVRIIGDPSLLLQANPPKPGSMPMDVDEIESAARRMVAELEADGKLQPGQKKTSATRALTKIIRRLARRAGS